MKNSITLTLLSLPIFVNSLIAVAQQPTIAIEARRNTNQSVDFRKGIVVDVKDLYETIGDDGVAYTSRTNELIVEHQDGTLATYRGFKKGSFTVKLGQTVFPGTSLGLNSKYDRNGRYNVSVMITYLKTADFEKSTSLSKSKNYYGFITPHFMTADNANEVLVSQKIYMTSSTPEVVQKEMSKRELKLLASPKK
jgi:hypothetical protein